MKRIILGLLIVGVIGVGCKKEPPSDGNRAVCYTIAPSGMPPICQNATGDIVTCPADLSKLPECSAPPPSTPAPTAAPTSTAVCYTPGLGGTPPFCKDSAGAIVTCPVDPTSLPRCE